MADPKVLADKPIADRRGDDVLDRHVHHVIDHPEPEGALIPGETADEAIKLIERSHKPKLLEKPRDEGIK